MVARRTEYLVGWHDAESISLVGTFGGRLIRQHAQDDVSFDGTLTRVSRSESEVERAKPSKHNKQTKTEKEGPANAAAPPKSQLRVPRKSDDKPRINVACVTQPHSFLVGGSLYLVSLNVHHPCQHSIAYQQSSSHVAVIVFGPLCRPPLARVKTTSPPDRTTMLRAKTIQQSRCGDAIAGDRSWQA